MTNDEFACQTDQTRLADHPLIAAPIGAVAGVLLVKLNVLRRAPCTNRLLATACYLHGVCFCSV
jgi:hypothetical protein